MERTWTDKRNGKEWKVEAIPMMQRMRPGGSVPMMNEVPWRIWFRKYVLDENEPRPG